MSELNEDDFEWSTSPEAHINTAVSKASKKYNVPASIIKDTIDVESSGNPNAVSPTGPQGLMQVSKAAAKDVGADPTTRFNIDENVDMGTAYYKQLYDEFGNDDLAHAAYYAGPTAIRAAVKTGNWASIPNEAAAYVQKFRDLTAARPGLNEGEFDWQLAERRAGMEHAQTPAELKDVATFNKVSARGPAAVSRYLEARKMGPWDKAMLTAGREVNKLAAGTNELGYNLAGLTGLADENAMNAKVNDIAAQQNANDEIYQEFKDAGPGFPGVVGSSLPYVVSNSLLGPLVSKSAGAIFNKLTDIPTTAVKEGKGVISSFVSRMADRGSNVAKGIQHEITGPWARNAMRASKQVPYIDPFREGQVGRVLGGTVQGAVESGLHYDQDAAQGAMTSGLSMLGIEALRPALINHPSMWRKSEEDLVEWFKDKGGKPLPGLATGSKKYQTFESKLRNESSLKDNILKRDQLNAEVLNDVAYDAMGIDSKRVGLLTPRKLSDHIKDLGKQYDALESGTVSKFTRADITNLDDHVTNIAKNTDIESKKTTKLVTNYVNLIKEALPLRNKLTGRIQSPIMTGSTYKELRSRIKADITDAFNSNDTQKANALKPILQTLDDAVERGVKDAGGEATVAQWKDLNERMAMSKLVMHKGMTPIGGFDVDKLTNHLMSNDPERLLMESGGRINELYKAVKVNYMMNKQARADLGSLGKKHFFNASDPSLIMQFLQSPMQNVLPRIPTMAVDMYAKGYPSVTGLLNMSGRGLGNPNLYARALSQGNQPWPSMYNYLDKKLTADNAKETSSRLKDKLKSFLRD